MPTNESRQAFSLLSEGVRKWVARKEWDDLRDVQVGSIMSMLGGEHRDNMVISCPTAGGKTEAAFLPALSVAEDYVNSHRDDNFVYILYVAPLKALINDQFRRMSDMARDTGIPVYMWHGDASQSQKKRLLKTHYGILMTTPESLEAFLMLRGQWCNDNLMPLITIIDEFHAFLGEGRGKQLMSLLDRIDAISAMNGREPATRIALSATLSKLDRVGKMLSPRAPFVIVDGNGTGASGDDMQIEVQTFDRPMSVIASSPKYDYGAMSDVIIRESEGHKTLTFAKSRYDVEEMTATINSICKERNIDSQAFPHHGSLSKETREELERRLSTSDAPTMAVATVTLELGIDIGDIYKVFQVGATNSVASLRQRIGRSGRRDGVRRMKCLSTLAQVPSDMEEDLTTTVAEIELMNEGWFEAADTKRKDVSVLVSEIMSVIKQYGSAYREELYSLLCLNGAFTNVNENLFDMVVDDMIYADYLVLTEDKTLLIGRVGEREVNDWHFYATFQTEESYVVKSGKKTIGEITPPSTSLAELDHGGTFMLAGKYWEVIPPIDMQGKVINVKQMKSRAQFLVPVSRGGGDVGGMVKQKRISLLNGKDSGVVPVYLDDNGFEALQDAREYAKSHSLNSLGLMIYDAGDSGSESHREVAARCAKGYVPDATVNCIPPVSGAAYDAIIKVMSMFGLVGEMRNIPLYRIAEIAYYCVENKEAVLANRQNYIDDAMLGDIRMKEKYNGILSDETLRLAYADEALDFKTAYKWIESFIRFWERIENDADAHGRTARKANGAGANVQSDGASAPSRKSNDVRTDTKASQEQDEAVNPRDKCW